MQLRRSYLLKALTFMKFFLYKQKMIFYQEDRYLWPHFCMNNLYISHRSLYAPTYSFWAIHSMLISLSRVTSLLIPFAIFMQVRTFERYISLIWEVSTDVNGFTYMCRIHKMLYSVLLPRAGNQNMLLLNTCCNHELCRNSLKWWWEQTQVW